MTTVAPAVCPAGACDPRGLGLNPIVNQIWSKYMPPPNDPIYGSPGGKQNIDASAGPEIEYGFAWIQRGEQRRIAAAERGF